MEGKVRGKSGVTQGRREPISMSRSDQPICDSDYLDFGTLSLITGWPKTMLCKLLVAGVFTRVKYMDAASGNRALIHLYDPAIPRSAWARYLAARGEPEIPAQEADAIFYASLPAWSKRRVDGWRAIFKATIDMSGAELKAFLRLWKAEVPSAKVSYPNYMKMLACYHKRGIVALRGDYGRFRKRKR